ncbi:MAG: VWA domain-containing protein, partial [Oscillospiraceae bacterium]|nr:VWA domain-containing protein [Oscillospiraceae bacterium]
ASLPSARSPAAGGDLDTRAAPALEPGASGSGGGGRAGQGMDAVRALMDQLERAVESCGGERFSSPPENIFRQGADTSEEDAAAAEQAFAEQGSTQHPEEMLQRVMDQIYADLMQEKAEALAAQDQLNEAVTHITTENMCSPHFGIALALRQAAPGCEDRKAYEQIIDTNRPYLNKIYKEVQKIIQEEGVTTQRHRYMGRRVDAKSAYKVDQRYFTKKKNPDKLLDMSVALLVDNSGSMGGKRLTAAKESAMLLTEVLEWLEIPTLIAGYHCDHALCYCVYKQFEDVRTAKYAVNQMTAEGDNRDGMALGITANFLAERTEKNKLLMILSDGQPNSSGYGGALAQNDIRAVVQSARRRGIKTLAFAIGEDQAQMKQIYGEAHIDISDEEQMPKALSRLLEKEILAGISSR